MIAVWPSVLLDDRVLLLLGTALSPYIEKWLTGDSNNSSLRVAVRIEGLSLGGTWLPLDSTCCFLSLLFTHSLISVFLPEVP